MDDAAVLEHVRLVVQVEQAALAQVALALDAQAPALVRLCRILAGRCGEGRPGKAVFVGVGKTGLIARKLAATCSSTGTPAIFLHPTEAVHGDLGLVGAEDVVVFITHSGASDELIGLMPALRRIGCTCACLVGPADAPLLRLCDLGIAIGRLQEACPLGLAPSASTTALLALGDAVALTTQKLRAFTPEQYARFHPAGALGRALTTCGEAMRPRARTAVCAGGTSIADCLRLITGSRSGSVLIADADDRLLGIFTDGDLRRALQASADPAATLRSPVLPLATVPCLSVRADQLASEALRLCASKHINELPVVHADGSGRIVGLIDVQDLAQRGFSV